MSDFESIRFEYDLLMICMKIIIFEKEGRINNNNNNKVVWISARTCYLNGEYYREFNSSLW